LNLNRNIINLAKLTDRMNIFKLSRHILAVSVMVTLTDSALGQSSTAMEDSLVIRRVFTHALTDGCSYEWLEHLCLRIGHRLSGSVGAERAVSYSKSVLDTLGLDSVWLQPVMVPRWVRGKSERVKVLGLGGRRSRMLSALALGGSVGTVSGGVRGAVVKISSWEELAELGEEGIRGKIVYYSRPMDQTKIRTFEAYGAAVDQRVFGASRAARYGAIGVIVRSVGTRQDNFPHTGTLRYDSTYALIPAVAISTNDSEWLNRTLEREGRVVVSMELFCRVLPDVLSYNVIGEIRGLEKPQDILLVGGHLDSWDVGHGAHDDGAGVVQSMDVLRLFRRMGYRPKHTIRCVLFMNEENGGRGGAMYAVESRRKGEYPLASIESDAGGFTPRGFTFEGDASVFGAFFDRITRYRVFFEPYGLTLTRGGSGADIGPLRDQKGLLSGYSPDSQRYFDLHHTALDVFSEVNKRELALGVGSMAALVYLLDRYGL
jgi:hypothetical protein